MGKEARSASVHMICILTNAIDCYLKNATKYVKESEFEIVEILKNHGSDLPSNYYNNINSSK